MLGSVGSMLSDDQILTHFCSQLSNRRRYVSQKVEKYFCIQFQLQIQIDPDQRCSHRFHNSTLHEHGATVG